MPRIDLPDGQWADLRDRVKYGDQKRMMRAIEAHETVLEKGIAMQGAMFGLIDAWSFELPLPKDDPASIDELDITVVHLLDEAIKPIQQKIFPTFAPSPDPASPSEPSSD